MEHKPYSNRFVFRRLVRHCRCAWYESRHFVFELCCFFLFCLLSFSCFFVGVVVGSDILKAFFFSSFFCLILFSRWFSIRVYVFVSFFACLFCYLCVLILLAFGFPFCSFTFSFLRGCL